MEIKGKHSARVITAIIIVLLIIIAFYFLLYRPLAEYFDTHTWATLQVHGNVRSETSDVLEECREFLQGDTYQLHNTVVIIEDITQNGEVTMKFEPAVINSDAGELIETIVINKEDILNIKEVCNDGDLATWQFRVVSNRYQ